MNNAHHKSFSTMRKKTFFLLSIIISLPVFSLPDDKEKPIHFTAGIIEWDQIHYKGTFKNKVSFLQGTTELYAESGYSLGDAEHQFNKIVVLGNEKQQAHFIVQPELKQPVVHAYADKMIYLPSKKLIELYGNVKVTQGRYHFTAPYLQYNTEEKKMLTKASQKELTILTVDPEKNDEKSARSKTSQKIF
jgi:lipopolysaccharide transport protein LptA